MVLKINHDELKFLIRLYYNTISNGKKPALFVWGRFGIGKSEAVLSVAQDLAREKGKTFIEFDKTTKKEKEELFKNPEKYFVLIDKRMSQSSPDDFKLPILDDKDYISNKVPMWALYCQQKDSDGIIFFDEINCAPHLVMSACYKIVYDKVIDEEKINSNWLIMGAGNTAEDRAYTHEVAPPLLDRGGEVELVGSDCDGWTSWGLQHDIDSWVIGFNNFKNCLYKVDFDDNQKFTTYRGWTRVSELLHTLKKTFDKNRDYKKIDLAVASAISEGVAKEFVAWIKIQEQINLEDIIKNPEKLKEIKEVSVKYFLLTAVADRYRENKIKFDKVLEISKAFDSLGNAEFVALLWRLCYSYNKQFRDDFLTKVDNKLADKYAKFII